MTRNKENRLLELIKAEEKLRRANIALYLLAFASGVALGYLIVLSI